MIWALGFVLTVAVVAYVGYPLFVREAEPAEDALEAAIAQRRGSKTAGARSSVGGGAVASGSARCGKCGAANQAGDRFCARCGTALGQRCANCGAAFEASDVFCAKCGTKLAGRAI